MHSSRDRCIHLEVDGFRGATEETIQRANAGVPRASISDTYCFPSSIASDFSTSLSMSFVCDPLAIGTIQARSVPEPVRLTASHFPVEARQSKCACTNALDYHARGRPSNSPVELASNKALTSGRESSK